MERGTIPRVANGGVSIVATPGGGPNGLALTGPNTAVIANNGGFLWTTVNGVSIPIDHATHTNEPPGFTGGWIEELDLVAGATRRLYDEFEGRPLRGPNDVVVDEVGGIWFTDHGKGRLESVDRGGAVLRRSGWCRVEAGGVPPTGPQRCGAFTGRRDRLRRPNPYRSLMGVGPDRARCGRTGWPAGSLAVRHGGRCVAATPYSLDSLAVEADGRVAIGAIGDGIVSVTPDGQEVEVHPIPGDVTTNITFGEDDMRTAIITLSRSGRLVRCRWPRPGLRLAY